MYSNYCWKENYSNLVSQDGSKEFSLTFKKQHFGQTRSEKLANNPKLNFAFLSISYRVIIHKAET